MKKGKFTLTDEFGGGCLQGEIIAPYKKLVEILGEPNTESDGYKVSTEWNIKTPKGKIVSIYDWKMTNLYESDYMSVESFRELPSYDWHIGGQCEADANELIEYLRSEGI